MPLVVAPTDVNLRVIKVMAEDKTKKHLENLGISINSNFKVISSVDGSVVLLIKDCRLALDRNLAAKILVTQGETC